MKTIKSKLHWEILTREQKKLLPKLAFLKERGFYLAGGTALALQIGHRKSIDFDFYSEKDFDPKRTLTLLKKKIPDITIISLSENTLTTQINKIGLSFFTYPYPSLQPLIQTEYFPLSSLEDITAMKLIAISQRGRRRDFIDLYYLMNYFSLEKIFQLTKDKFSPFNPYIGLQGLVYFEDAEDLSDPRNRPPRMLQRGSTWSTIKKYFIQKAELVGDSRLLKT